MREKARAQLLSEEHPGMAGGAAQPVRRAHVAPLGCTIEQLENGGCSHHIKVRAIARASNVGSKLACCPMHGVQTGPRALCLHGLPFAGGRETSAGGNERGRC